MPPPLSGSATQSKIGAIRLRRVKLLARDATPVRMQMSSDGLELRAVTQDVGEGVESAG